MLDPLRYEGRQFSRVIREGDAYGEDAVVDPINDECVPSRGAPGAVLTARSEGVAARCVLRRILCRQSMVQL